MQMVGSFGPRLREERERKELSLQAIADETKIKVSLLEGLEQDDLSFWPTGLFRRAYVRAYARAIGLDPERTVREFLEKYPEPVEPASDDPIRSPRDLLSSPIATVSSLLRRGSRSGPVLTRPPAPVNGGSPPAIDEAIPEAGVIEETIPEPSLLEMSELCTRLGRLSDLRGLPALLDDAARVLDAIGLVVWRWDSGTGSLRAELANGYPAETIAHLPAVAADAPNAVATAFRSGEACLVPGDTELTAAVAVPVMAPAGCVGVLAIEVRNGCEQFEWIRAFAAILAAQLAGFLGTVALAEAVA
jgi:transcriptional regulator with XRE-family HTH domain